MSKGFFIVLEGIDGCGKGEVANRLELFLKSSGYEVEHTLEPNEAFSPVGRVIKRILRHELPIPETMLEFQRLYVLDRGQDLVAFVNPALAQGKIYIMERFALSTIAYGMSAGISIEELIDLHYRVIGNNFRWPDLTIILDIPAEIALQRINYWRRGTELFEKKERLEKVRNNYLELAKRPEFKDSTFVINGDRNKDEVAGEVIDVVRKAISKL